MEKVDNKILVFGACAAIVGVAMFAVTVFINTLCRYQPNFGTNGGQYICVRSK